jgi:suppressor for copper-sensitivity B
MRKSLHKPLTSLIISLFLLIGAKQAIAASTPWVINDQTQVRLISSKDSSTHWLGVHFKLAQGWHIYWRSPGDAGMPPTFDWHGSTNINDAQMLPLWPVPQRSINNAGLQDFAYHDEVVFPFALPLQNTAAPSTLQLALNYVACKDICVPFSAAMNLNIPQSDSDPEAHALIGKFRSHVPAATSKLAITQHRLIHNSQGKLFLEVKATSATPFVNPDIFVEGNENFRFLKPQSMLADDRLSGVFIIPAIANSPKQELAGKPLKLTLVSNGTEAVETNITTTATLTPIVPGVDSVANYSLLLILGFAFLGGLILNIMPCVLPVLSIKLFGIIKHGGANPSHVRFSFIASALGIITSFLIVAGGLAVMQLLGHSVGFGFQFQEPVFVISLIVILVIFACNLLGLFEINLPARLTDFAVARTSSNAGPIASNFLTGVFATVLATPCTAPFLGTAISFALSHSPLHIMLIFAMMGVGMSFPYLLLAQFPGYIRFMPKPGAWMVTARYILGIALFATALWLIYVLAGQLGIKAAVLLLFICLLLKFFIERSRGLFAYKFFKLPVIGLTIALAFFIPLTTVKNDAAITQTRSTLWKPFEQDKIVELVQQGQIVFVDVTADWCITCKVNKLTTLNRSDVVMLLASPTITAMRADITSPNPAINTYLKSFERYGIPFNVVYGPKTPDGIPLSILLTKGDILHAMKKAGWKPSGKS